MKDKAPEEGETWIHNNGLLYKVLFLANDSEMPNPAYPVSVIYEGENGKKWVRELSDWHRSFKRRK